MISLINFKICVGIHTYTFVFLFSQKTGGVIINISATLYYKGDMLQAHAGSAKAAIGTMLFKYCKIRKEWHNFELYSHKIKQCNFCKSNSSNTMFDNWFPTVWNNILRFIYSVNSKNYIKIALSRCTDTPPGSRVGFQQCESS